MLQGKALSIRGWGRIPLSQSGVRKEVFLMLKKFPGNLLAGSGHSRAASREDALQAVQKQQEKTTGPDHNISPKLKENELENPTTC